MHEASDILELFVRIRGKLPNELVSALRPVAYMEYRCEAFEQATRSINARQEMRRLAAAVEAVSKESADEAQKGSTTEGSAIRAPEPTGEAQ